MSEYAVRPPNLRLIGLCVCVCVRALHAIEIGTDGIHLANITFKFSNRNNNSKHLNYLCSSANCLMHANADPALKRKLKDETK